MPAPRLLPAAIREKIAGFPEYRMGAHKVALVLRDGRVVEDVVVAWEKEIVSEGNRTELSFAPEDAVDVMQRS
ncbi:MAG TPA: hypothetical protein VFA20_34305 [Myxococcaceae bacterium]|nr:hypothetical protein [Myxococcaceae bacterium]